MLDQIFMQVLDMTKIAGVVILVVMIARLLLKKAPKVFSYMLWAVVLFRLLCPVSFQAPVSIVPEVVPVSEDYALAEEPISFAAAGEAAYRAAGDALNGGLGIQRIKTTELDENGTKRIVTTDWWDIWVLFGQYVWTAGIAVMAARSVADCFHLRKKLQVVVKLRDNIYIADDIQSPFVSGFARPKIYLPAGLKEKEQEYIILHEQYHIKRLDPLMKALAYLALCIHWFNPLVWAAFMLACKDMEMSCDEAVVKKLGEGIRADYAASLLTFAAGHRMIAGTPLAFGEGDTKGRIKNLAGWKKPALWVSLAAALVCMVLAVCLITDPENSRISLIGTDYGMEVVTYNETVDSVGVYFTRTLTEHVGEDVDIYYTWTHADMPGYVIVGFLAGEGGFNEKQDMGFAVFYQNERESAFALLDFHVYENAGLAENGIYLCPDPAVADIDGEMKPESTFDVILINNDDVAKVTRIYEYADGETKTISEPFVNAHNAALFSWEYDDAGCSVGHRFYDESGNEISYGG